MQTLYKIWFKPPHADSNQTAVIYAENSGEALIKLCKRNHLESVDVIPHGVEAYSVVDAARTSKQDVVSVLNPTDCKELLGDLILLRGPDLTSELRQLMERLTIQIKARS